MRKLGQVLVFVLMLGMLGTGYGYTAVHGDAMPMESIVTFTSQPMPPAAAVENGDSLALVELYKDTGGPSWTDNTNWLAGPVDTWFGVTVAGDRVTAVELRNNNLSGEIPPALSGLDELVTLDLSENHLYGVIPIELCSFRKLQVLNLRRNQLSGSIPRAFVNIQSLRELMLDFNDFSGEVHPVLTQMTWLNRLNLSRNNLSDLPSFSSYIGQALDFEVGGNGLTFEDLEHNMGIIGFAYTPQAGVPIEGPSINPAVEGRFTSMEVHVGGTANVYQWYKDDVPVAGANASKLAFPHVVRADSGVYHCRISNTLVPGLTLRSDSWDLKVVTAAHIALSPPHYDFGPRVPECETNRIFTFYNMGGEDLIITDVKLTGVDTTQFRIYGLELPMTIKGYWHYEFDVHFRPGTKGVKNVTMEIESNCAYRPHLESRLQGTCQYIDRYKPELTQTFPVPDARAVPVNAGFWWKMADKLNPLNPSSLNISVNDVPVVVNGVSQSADDVLIAISGNEGSVFYAPAEDMPSNQPIKVDISVADTYVNPNVMAKSYYFTTGDAVTVATSVSNIDAAGGQVADSTTGVTLTVPPDALEEPTIIVVSRVSSLPALPDSVQSMGLNLHFWPDGLKFKQPVAVSIPWNQQLLDSAGVADAADLPLYYFSSTKGTWRRLVVIGSNATHIFTEITEFCYLVMGRFEQPELTAVEDEPTLAPRFFRLHQNYPNPFNPETTIGYELDELGPVTLKIFDLRGRLVAKLVDDLQPQGRYQVLWQATDGNGVKVPSGVYIYELRCGQAVMRKKCLLVK